MSFPKLTDAVSYCQAARQSLQQGRIDQAIALLQETLARDPRSAEAYSLLGVAYAQKGMLNEGIQALHTAVKLDPNSASARLNLGVALQRAGRLHEAAAELQEALRLDPNHQKAQELLSAMQTQMLQNSDSSELHSLSPRF
jgi:Flp pilus assembly protein TadD